MQQRLTIRQDELDTRVLPGLATEMLRDDVVAAFLAKYEAESRRLTAETVSAALSGKLNWPISITNSRARRRLSSKAWMRRCSWTR